MIYIYAYTCMRVYSKCEEKENSDFREEISKNQVIDLYFFICEFHSSLYTKVNCIVCFILICVNRSCVHELFIKQNCNKRKKQQ